MSASAALSVVPTLQPVDAAPNFALVFGSVGLTYSAAPVPLEAVFFVNPLSVLPPCILPPFMVNVAPPTDTPPPLSLAVLPHTEALPFMVNAPMENTPPPAEEAETAVLPDTEALPPMVNVPFIKTYTPPPWEEEDELPDTEALPLMDNVPLEKTPPPRKEAAVCGSPAGHST
jgi:hypothetical protein